MDFLFAIPSFIFHLISSLFSWVFSVISGILGIVIWPVKLLWGFLMGVGKTLISIVLLPTLLFSHPGDISATQPVVSTTPAIPNNNIEQIYNEISLLEKAGINMEALRTPETLGQCGDQMRKYQKQAQDLVEITDALPLSSYATLMSAARTLNTCVSCQTDAKKQCELVRQDLSNYQSNDE